MHDHALVEGVAGLPGTFLAALPPPARERLLADAAIHETQAGSSIFSAAEAVERTGVILRGMARTHMSSVDGRRLSVRFARPGSVVGSLMDGRASLSVQAVVPCTMLELSLGTLSELIAEDGRVGLAVVSEMARRLRETYTTLASNTFGSMRERVARQLFDLATDGPGPARLVAPITQQGLADGVGTVREVVARVLRDFREEGLITTADGCIEIVDPDGLALIVSGARPNARLTMATAR